MRLGLGLGLRGTYSPSVTVNPLRVVTTQNRVNSNTEGQTGLTRQVVRWAYIMGTDANTICVGTHMWRQGTSTSPDNANGLEILGAAIEANGTHAALSWSSAPNKALLGGDNGTISDEIPASAFGLAYFAKGSTIWFRAILEVPAAGLIPFTVATIDNTSGNQVGWYNPSNTTPSTIYATGAITATGTAFTARTAGFRPLILGRPLTDGASFLAVGDSIGEIVNDNVGSTTGGGFIQRSMRNAASTDFRPCINFSRNGAAASAFRGTNTKWTTWLQYVTYAIDELGTNTLGTSPSGSNLTTLQSQEAEIWASMRSGNVRGIIRTCLLPRTSATSDNYTTEAGQTINAGWGSGEFSDQFNAWLATKLADDTIDYLIDPISVRGVNPFKWVVNGVNNYATADGTHPQQNASTSQGHELIATDVRAVTLTI